MASSSHRPTRQPADAHPAAAHPAAVHPAAAHPAAAHPAAPHPAAAHPESVHDRGVQYVYCMMHKCIMVKIGGSKKHINRKGRP